MSAGMPLNTETTRQSLSPAVTIPIAAGTHSFELVGSWFNGDELVPTWRDASITASFSPFNGSGGTTPPAAAEAEAATPSRTAPDVRGSGD